MNTVKNKVIVWSIDDFNTLGLMRELGNADLDMLFLIKGHAGFAAKSKFCQKYVETDSVESGFTYLKEHFAEEENKPIVIIASDDIVTFVDEHRDELEKRYILPLTVGKGDTKKYTDKNAMTKLAQEIGILCPASQSVRWDSPIEGVEYPCLIKPSHQKPGHYNEFKFKICKTEKALKKVLRYVRHDSEFILQQYIPKELDVLIYGCRMRDGQTAIAGAMLRDRCADSGSSSHGYLSREVPSCIDINKSITYIEKIGFYGPFSFEYGMVGERAYFFEVNLRNDGTSHCFFQAGANLPLAYVYSCAGLEYSTIPTQIAAEQWFIDEVFDIENVINRKISKRKWEQDYSNATIFKYYDKDDPIPWEIVRKGKKKQILKDFLLKRFRLYIVYVLDKLGLRK